MTLLLSLAVAWLALDAVFVIVWMWMHKEER